MSIIQQLNYTFFICNYCDSILFAVINVFRKLNHEKCMFMVQKKVNDVLKHEGAPMEFFQ